MNLDQFCQQLQQRLAALPTGAERLAAAARGIQQTFAVGLDEVAFFQLKEGGVLSFLWPEKLQKVGFIPLSSHDSLAARTLRENRAFLNNRFASARHAGVFEFVHLDKERKERPLPIQKILSAPLPGPEGTPRGVVQVSRKGVKDDPALADFSQNDLAVLTRLATLLGPLITA